MSPQKSTIDRISDRRPEAPSLPMPPGIRSTFRVLERVSPAVGGLVAERLWFRLPPAPDRSRREQRTPPGGEAFEVAWDGGVVAGRVYGHWGDPTAYLLHGWGGWWQQLSAHVEPLVDAGLCVVAFDAPSHGGSPPGRYGRRSTTLVEVADALAAVVAEFGRPTAVVAHSAGSMAALHARRSRVLPDSYVFLAPPESVTPMMRRFSGLLGVGPQSRDRMLERASRRVGLPLADFDLAAIARAVPAHPPLLVVHDRHDPETPAVGSVALTDAWPGAELLLTDGLGHRRVMWDASVVERVTGHVAGAADQVRRSSR